VLKKITIENYRSCLRTTFECHPRLSVLIGPNGSGKTNVLQAILFLYKIWQDDEYQRFREEPITVTSRIRALFHVPPANAVLNASIDAYTDASNNDIVVDAKRRWTLSEAKGKKIAVQTLPWHSRGVIWYHRQAHARRPRQTLLADSRGRVLCWPGDKPGIIEPWISSSVAKVVQFCSGIRYYSASQFTNPSACPVSFEIEKEGPRSRHFRAPGHARTLYRMYMAQKNEDDKYANFMSMVGPKGLGLVDDVTFKEVPTSSIDYAVRVGGRLEKRRRCRLLIIPRFRIGRHKLSPNQLSEGTFKTLALLFYIMTEESKALLIEEPEVCIHQGLLASILELMKTHADRKQMIVSTHSDYVLDHVSPDNVFQVKRDKLEGTHVKHIRKNMTRKEFSALRHYLQSEGNLGEYWREGALED